MSAVVARQMIGAELLKLRRKRGLVAWALVLTVGAVVVLFVVNAARHSSDPGGVRPAGGTDGFVTARDLLGLIFGPLAAVLIGAEAGATDTSSGVFRDLVVTGRSRLALFLVRLPGALLLCLALIAVGFGVAVAASFAFVGGLPAPSAAALLKSAGWLALADGVVCVVAVGLASLTGSRAATITVLIGWELVASPLLLSVESLGSAREALLAAALLRLRPASSDVTSDVAMSLGAVVLVLVLWAAIPCALGAWRTRTRDA